ncbi:hypothetical protein JCM10207_002709, partial [Rhodosporidiobolus poonsookiae]
LVELALCIPHSDTLSKRDPQHPPPLYPPFLPRPQWPAYFQSAKATTTIRSAVDFLPIVCIVSPSAMLVGMAVTRFQHYRTQNWVGWIFLTVGLGLLTLTDESTSTAGWVLIPMVVALGIGMNYAAPVFAVLAPLPPAISGPALAFQLLVRTMGNVLGISIGSTVLTNVLGQKLPQEFIDMIPNGLAGAYSAIPEIRGLDEPLKMQVRVAFAEALRVVWIVMIPFAGVAFLISLAMRSLPLAAEVDETFGVKEKRGRDSLDSCEKADPSEHTSTIPEGTAEQPPVPGTEVAAEQPARSA